MQAIMKSFLATVQRKQNILMQKYFQLSQIPFQSISQHSPYLNLKVHVILVFDVRRSLQQGSPTSGLSTGLVQAC